ncbi:hypothetical protein [Aeromonas phage 51]|uniref:Uncharacterized protein n=3 Tax=Popoffvirus pv56 TaxID=2560283 RepID=A0A219YB94_9CAUD|nr:hypothetical protein F394_gp53 [Aeromonas phage vB_AsaM-56]AFC22649.1 hypothetical protein AsaM-56_0053 [Aeromonas phage vB_AsaM-56]APU01276.1 hypothetical protein [Aeromonas phage 51]APU01360.1 hypothetical protein [Aeromonas phage 56]
MKISNSKKELARIISENGGWRNGEFAAQDSDGGVGGYEVKPEWNSRSKYWWRAALGEWFFANKIKNHHQTVLSRAEYFHLYPVLDAKPEFCESVMRSIPEPSDKPTIEQLATDYRNAKDYANRKQDEADKANMESDAALAQLEDAIAAIGFVITPLAATEKEPELVIADWRDLQVGDEIYTLSGEVVTVTGFDKDSCEWPVLAVSKSGGDWIVGKDGFTFIRRP